MKERLLSRRTLTAVVIPAFIIGFQIFAKWYNNADSTASIGTSLAALALGQVFPFMIFDHLIINKLFTYKADYEKVSDAEIIARYKIVAGDKPQEVKNIQLQTFVIFAVLLLIFLFAILLSFKPEAVFLNLILGIFAVSISLTYIIFV